VSLHQLPAPCWIIHTADGPLDAHLNQPLHFTNANAANREIAQVIVDWKAAHAADQLTSLTALSQPGQCWEVRCDDCGKVGNDHRDAQFHYPTEQSELDAVGDWRTDRTGAPSLCEDCAAVADCVEYGHVFGEWYRCACGGTIATHADGCLDFRICERCLEGDYPAYPDDTTDKAVA